MKNTINVVNCVPLKELFNIYLLSCEELIDEINTTLMSVLEAGGIISSQTTAGHNDILESNSL